MAKGPWHALMERVHHSHQECAAGQAAQGKYQRSGTGGKPLCPECARLHALDERQDQDHEDAAGG